MKAPAQIAAVVALTLSGSAAIVLTGCAGSNDAPVQTRDRSAGVKVNAANKFDTQFVKCVAPGVLTVETQNHGDSAASSIAAVVVGTEVCPRLGPPTGALPTGTTGR